MNVEMNSAALEDLKDQAWEQGYRKGFVEGVRQTEERLEMAHQEKTIEALRESLLKRAEEFDDLQVRLLDSEEFAQRRHAADQEHIRATQAALEPKQAQIHMLQIKVNEQRATIDELRQALLKHITETA